MEQRRYRVFNRTDGVYADPRILTREEAEVVVRDFPKRFERQGYYLTGSRERIPPMAVELEIVDEGEERPAGYYLRGSAFLRRIP